MPLAAHHVAVAENGGKIYVFGGGVQKQAGAGAYVPANNAWEYDPAADSWKALAAMPTPRLAAVAVAAGGKIYVMGGAGNVKARDGQSLDPNQPHRVLDVQTRSTTRRPIRGPRSRFSDAAELDVHRRRERKDLSDRRRVASAFATTGSVTDVRRRVRPGDG